MCHRGSPPTRNVWGAAIEAVLLPGTPRPISDADYAAALPAALRAVESIDSDGDGFTNGDEVVAGTSPADALHHPDVSTCPPFNRNGDWDVCFYDSSYVFKKLRLDFCGQSPSFEETQVFLGIADADKAGALDAELDRCLDSEFWIGKNGQLWQLANRKIRPLGAIKSGEDAGEIPIADYYDDYSLFAYTQTDNHDARDVLLATYFVMRSTGPTRYVIGAPGGEQGVVEPRRAGLMTTRWNLIYNIMFTALPRTAAAQAYRAFLGLDIAKLEGLRPVDNEPEDYDGKGVTQDACRICHSTLDPLSYPFKNYQGLTGNNGTYDSNRIQRNFANEAPNITSMPEAGSVLGQPVLDLRAWAQVAANSNEFAAATVLDYWKLLMGGLPRASENDEYIALWRDFRDPGRHDYRVERMLHALIRTEAYGVP